MQIKGMKHLRKNDYDSIIINQGSINIYGSSKWPSMKMSHSIEDELSCLSDEEQSNRIVDYYLDYNPVNCIDEAYYHAGKQFIRIISTTGSELKFGRKPCRESINKILKRYQDTRFQVSHLHTASSFKFYTSSSYTGFFEDNDSLTFVLYQKENGLLEMEYQFLETFLPILFGENEVSIRRQYREDEHGFKQFEGHHIVGSDNMIKIDLELLQPASIIVLNHNARVRKMQKQKEEYKQLELKMEGF